METWTVTGGQGRRRITRPCQSREEAEDWARKVVAAGIGPVTINGTLFESKPEISVV